MGLADLCGVWLTHGEEAFQAVSGQPVVRAHTSDAEPGQGMVERPPPYFQGKLPHPLPLVHFTLGLLTETYGPITDNGTFS